MEKVHSFGSSCDRLLGLLADARKKSGLSLDDVAERSGVKRAHVEAIDNGRLDFLPPAYVVSELRQYAAFLGVGDAELFDEVKKEANIPVMQVASGAVPGRVHDGGARKMPLLYIAVPAGTLVLIALLWIGAGLVMGERTLPADVGVVPSVHTVVVETGDDVISGEDAGVGIEGPGDARTAGDAGAEMVVAGVSGQHEGGDPLRTLEEGGPVAEAVVPGGAVPDEPGIVADVWPAMVRGQFTTMVDRSRREPADTVDRVSLAAGAVYFFSEISGQKGERVVHTWFHEGQLNDRIELGTVTSDRWRGWSMKRLYPSRVGSWRVVVETGSGDKLGEANLVVVEDE